MYIQIYGYYNFSSIFHVPFHKYVFTERKKNGVDIFLSSLYIFFVQPPIGITRLLHFKKRKSVKRKKKHFPIFSRSG